MTSRDEFARFLEKQKVVKGDAIFVLQGDGIFRAAAAVARRGHAVVPAWVVVKLWGGSRPAQSVTPILAEAETKPKR